MTTKTTTFTKPDRDFKPYPEFPPRDDMQNWNYLYSRGQAAALAIHLGDRETTTAGCEIPMGPTLNRHTGIRVPDLMVSRDSRPELILEHGGYAIDRQGKPPDFVLEVAFKTTGVIDYTDKRADYERYGISEYWRFDPPRGEYHDTALAGGRLVEERYQPVEIEWFDELHGRGYSEALGLYLCWEDGELRFYDPETEDYIRAHDEEIARAEREAGARLSETARADRAEAELRRLRERLAALDDATDCS
ncbi:MAG: Uma2 family endonuclease [Dehalococcoidia bacterium]|nr:Uma2 family endonuclease [Dehalococcoidia bacterium]